MGEMVGGITVETFVESAFGYLCEQRAGRTTLTNRIRVALDRSLAEADGQNTLVWTHNLGIARNLIAMGRSRHA